MSRNLKVLFSVFALTVASASARADIAEEPLVNPADETDVWGKKITGLGEKGNEVALVFTKVGETMTWTADADYTDVRFLVVGGGGSGGSTPGEGGSAGGGGGAGGMATGIVEMVTAGTTLSFVVGAGGVYSTSKTAGEHGTNGGDSKISVGETDYVIAKGGGYGGGYPTSSATVGGSGGSAGAAGGNKANTAVAVGTAKSLDDYDTALNLLNADCGVSGVVLGHSAGGKSSSATHGSGGGGAGKSGSAGPSSVTEGQSSTGVGGDGAISDITGEEIYYAGGGGGGAADNTSKATSAAGVKWGALGGKGGGGQGGSSNKSSNLGGSLSGANGTANTGGGGGGAGYWTSAKGGNGGSGIVVIRYTMSANFVPVPDVASKVYTGEPLKADIADTEEYVVTGNDEHTEVGEYSLTVTLNGGYTWLDGTADPTNLVFAITQAQNEWTVEPVITKEQWFTSDEPGVLTAGATKFGKPAATIAKDGGAAEPFGGELPTDAGAYEIVYATATTDNYLAPDTTEKSVVFTIYSDDVTPDFDVALNGDIATGAGTTVTATVPYRVSCGVESEKTVSVFAQYALDGATTTNTVTLAEDVALDATGVGVLPDLLPGTNYWLSLYGQGGETIATNTTFVRFATINPVGDLQANYSFDETDFIISGSALPRIGMTTLTVHYSLNSEACDQTASFGPFAVGDEATFELRIPFVNPTDTLTWYVSAENAYNEVRWTKTTDVKTNDRQDVSAVTYTWKGGESGVWCDSANWTPSRQPAYGYPCNSKARAKFPSSYTNVTVNLGGKKIEIYEQTSAPKTLENNGLQLANKGTLTIENGSLNIGVGTIGLSNCKRVRLQNGAKIYTTTTGTEPNLFKAGGGNVLELAGNATVTFPTTLGTYEGGNTVEIHGTNNVATSQMRNNNSDSTVRVYDGDMTFDSTLRVNPSRTLTLAVSNATVSANYYRIDDGDVKMAFDIFVPAEGLNAAPVRARTLSNSGKFNNQTKLTLRFERGFSGPVPLMTNVQFADTAAFTAFTNSLTTVPRSYAERTTIRRISNDVYADVKQTGMMIYVK